MPVDFNTLTLPQAAELLAGRLDDGAAENRAFYDGEHWSPGGESASGWVGPRPQTNATNAREVLQSIETAFISKNVVREVTHRHRDGCIGREPSWSFTVLRPLAEGEGPNEREKALIDEAEAALTAWWDERKAHGTLKTACVTLLLEAASTLRLFVPQGLLKARPDGVVEFPRSDLGQALRRIYLMTPDAAQAGVYMDPDTMAEVGVYTYQETTAPNQSTGQDKAELSYLDEQGGTVVKILGNGTETEATTLQLGGRLTIFQLERQALLTPQVRQLQKLLNMALSMLGRNVVLGGFLERIILNAQMPGTWTGEGPDRVFTPSQITVGAGTTNVLQGVLIEDSDGKTRIATPSVQYRDPVSVQTFADTERIAYRGMLEETEQVHALISGDATSSGESRKQARDGFEKSLLDTAPELNRAIRWLLETALAMAAFFAGRAGDFEGLRAVAECRIDAGPKTAEEERQVIEAHNAGLLSRETSMARIGVEDVDAEAARIAAEREAEIDAGARRATARAEDEPPEGEPEPERPPIEDEAA